MLPSRHRLAGAAGLASVLAVLFTACDAMPPNRSAEVDDLTRQISAMPGVESATDVLRDRPAQDAVYFTICVDMADDITGEQLAAVASRYLDNLRTGDYTDYRSELDVRHGSDVFAVESGKRKVANEHEIVRQARDFVAIRHELAGATVQLRATVSHPDGPLSVREWGHSNVGTIELADASDYTDVASTVGTLATKFPQLGSVDWSIRAGYQHPAYIRTSRRLPTAPELDVWNKINADQTIPHIDKLTINGRTTTPVWISEQTLSRDADVAVQLAHRHLPTVAVLTPPTLYTASDQIEGHIGGFGRAKGPVAITVGGCTDRDSYFYKPGPAEQPLINFYERCHP